MGSFKKGHSKLKPGENSTMGILSHYLHDLSQCLMQLKWLQQKQVITKLKASVNATTITHIHEGKTKEPNNPVTHENIVYSMAYHKLVKRAIIIKKQEFHIIEFSTYQLSILSIFYGLPFGDINSRIRVYD